jgi:hypothetical protein
MQDRGCPTIKKVVSYFCVLREGYYVIIWLIVRICMFIRDWNLIYSALFILKRKSMKNYRYMVCSAISSYSFGATALIFCRMFIHIMEVCMSTGFWFSSNILKMTGNKSFIRLEKRYAPALDNYGQSCFVRSDFKKMKCVCKTQTTALIFCRMFIPIMEVCMSTGFWWSGGGIVCVLQTHFIFLKSLLTKQLCP